MAEKNKPPMTAVIDIEGVSFEATLRLFAALSSIYKSIGGDKLVLKGGECNSLDRKADAKLKKKGFIITNQRLDSGMSPYATKLVDREEVYQTIDNITEQKDAAEIKTNLDLQFPKRVWDDRLPFANTAIYFINNYADKL